MSGNHALTKGPHFSGQQGKALRNSAPQVDVTRGVIPRTVQELPQRSRSPADGPMHGSGALPRLASEGGRA